MAPDQIRQQALALSPGERIRLVDELLESVVAERGSGGLDQIQKAELLRRLAADRADPGGAIPWSTNIACWAPEGGSGSKPA